MSQRSLNRLAFVVQSQLLIMLFFIYWLTKQLNLCYLARNALVYVTALHVHLIIQL